MDAEATRPVFDADRPRPAPTGRVRPASRLIVAVKGASLVAWSLARRIGVWPRHDDAMALSDHQLADIGLTRDDVERPRESLARLHHWPR